MNINGYGNYANHGKNYGVGKNFEKNFEKTHEKQTEQPDFQAQLDKKAEEAKKKDSLYISSANEKADKLSKTAQDYLAKLKKENPNMDFIISDYSTDEEADALLAKGKGEYNVLITPDLLEKMAADEEVAAEYEGIIHNSVAEIEGAKETLAEDADMVEKFGITVNEDGEVRYSASLIEGLTGDDGTNTVKASTMEELLEKLNKVKESQAEKLAANVEGARVQINAKDKAVIQAVVAGTMIIDQTTGKGVKI